MQSILPSASPAELRMTQHGALCWRHKAGGLQVLLITSRDTGRWIIPKGWPIAGLTPERSAAREAFEEAGVLGTPQTDCLGLYTYVKAPARDSKAAPIPCVVSVFPLHVENLKDRYPESNQRRRKWMAPQKAATKVAEADLQNIILNFAPPLQP